MVAILDALRVGTLNDTQKEIVQVLRAAVLARGLDETGLEQDVSDLAASSV